MAAVAALFQRTFRDPRRAAPADLADYFRSLYLDTPHRDPEIGPLVFTGPAGAVEGFVGILPSRMTVGGRSVRAAVAGTLMVDRPGDNPLAGARLLRAFFSGPQDLSLTESANPLSQAMWRQLGARSVPGCSLEWLRVLRPAGFAVAAAAETARAVAVLGPVGGVIDAVVSRAGLNRFAPASDARRGRPGIDVDEEAFADAFRTLTESFAVRPDWDADQLAWRLGHAALKKRHGPRVLRVIPGRGGAPAGCYAYYGRPRGIAWVLQMLARPGDYGRVVDDMLAHAHDNGCAAVRGRIMPGLSDALFTRRCLFLHRSAAMYRTADAELAACLERGDALITGLAGESWTRLIGHEFQ